MKSVINSDGFKPGAADSLAADINIKDLVAAVAELMRSRSERNIIRLPRVMDKTGMSRTSIYDGIQKRTFPAQVLLSQRSVGWYEDQVDDWVANRIEARKHGGIASTSSTTKLSHQIPGDEPQGTLSNSKEVRHV